MAQWNIDPMHSEVQFKVKHLMISTVTGSFSTYEGAVSTANDTDFDGASIIFTADIDSISTGQPQRDGDGPHGPVPGGPLQQVREEVLPQNRY